MQVNKNVGLNLHLSHYEQLCPYENRKSRHMKLRKERLHLNGLSNRFSKAKTNFYVFKDDTLVIVIIQGLKKVLAIRQGR